MALLAFSGGLDSTDSLLHLLNHGRSELAVGAPSMTRGWTGWRAAAQTVYGHWAYPAAGSGWVQVLIKLQNIKTGWRTAPRYITIQSEAPDGSAAPRAAPVTRLGTLLFRLLRGPAAASSNHQPDISAERRPPTQCRPTLAQGFPTPSWEAMRRRTGWTGWRIASGDRATLSSSPPGSCAS